MIKIHRYIKGIPQDVRDDFQKKALVILTDRYSINTLKTDSRNLCYAQLMLWINIRIVGFENHFSYHCSSICLLYTPRQIAVGVIFFTSLRMTLDDFDNQSVTSGGELSWYEKTWYHVLENLIDKATLKGKNCCERTGLSSQLLKYYMLSKPSELF